MENTKTISALTKGVKLAYLAGQLGWSIASFGVMNLLFYFYDANVVDGLPMFPRVLPTLAILSVIAGIGRVLDAVTDPIIAGLSDRNKHPFGRRRLFMAIGGFPFVLLSVLVFIPPVAGMSWLNGAWVAVMILLFYLFMTIYITPYFALIAELGHDSKGRLELSTWIAVAWALGFLIGNGIYALQGVFEQLGLLPVRAFQATLAIYALVSLVLVYLPVIFVDEKKYCYPRTSKQGIWEAVKSSFQNRNFRVFAIADLVYFIALTFIQTGNSYYIIQLLGEKKEMATTFMSLLFLVSFLLYVPISKLAQRWGNKKTIVLSFVLLIAGAAFMSTWGRLPLPPAATNVITIALMIFPVSAFGFLLYAIAGDIAEADGLETGNFKEGLFYGTRTFMSKMGTAVTLFIFPYVSHLGGGESVTETGLRVSLLLAALLLTVGLLIFLRYDEKGIKAVLHAHNEE